MGRLSDLAWCDSWRQYLEPEVRERKPKPKPLTEVQKEVLSALNEMGQGNARHIARCINRSQYNVYQQLRALRESKYVAVEERAPRNGGMQWYLTDAGREKVGGTVMTEIERHVLMALHEMGQGNVRQVSEATPHNIDTVRDRLKDLRKAGYVEIAERKAPKSGGAQWALTKKGKRWAKGALEPMTGLDELILDNLCEQSDTVDSIAIREERNPHEVMGRLRWLKNRGYVRVARKPKSRADGIVWAITDEGRQAAIAPNPDVWVS